MNASRLLLPAVFFAVALRLLAAPVDSRIAGVTVYQDRAVVTRTATVQLGEGTTELVFANLPQALNEQSLQVTGRGTAQATILDVSAKHTYVDYTPDARVKELEDQLKGLGKQMRGIEDRQNLLNLQSSSLDRIENTLFAPPTKEAPRPALNELTTSLNYLVEQRGKIVAERSELEEQRTELQNKIDTVHKQLNELRGTGGRGFKTVTVRVSAPQAGNLEVALAYTVPGASWIPSYDARVLSGDRAVQLNYFGIVRQSTGEDWQDVAVTLSTARPSLGGAAPTLPVWIVDVFNPLALREQKAREESLRRASLDLRAAPAAVNLQSLTSNSAAESDDARVVDAGFAGATVEAGTTSASFKITGTSTIPSDNSPQKVPITAATLPAAPEYLTVPKRQPAAFLTAKVANGSEFPLLAGAMNVFLDGTFVATSSLRTVMPGEKFDLALGVDDGIAVKHRRVQKFTEDTGLTNSGKRITYEHLITVQNNKRTAERVIVADQVPLSRNEKIVVKVLTPDAREMKPTSEGTLKWTLDLKPGEKREITVKLTVEYPNEVNVAGLD